MAAASNRSIWINARSTFGTNQPTARTYRGAERLRVLLRGQRGDLEVFPDPRHELGGADDLNEDGHRLVASRGKRKGVLSSFLIGDSIEYRPRSVTRLPSRLPHPTWTSPQARSIAHTYLREVEDDVPEALLDVAKQEVRGGRVQLPHGLARQGRRHAAAGRRMAWSVDFDRRGKPCNADGLALVRFQEKGKS